MEAVAEAEFDHEAAQMLSNMGFQDTDTLNFFLSSKYTAGNEEWKEGLRKPSPPRFRRGVQRVPRNEVDGFALRKHFPEHETTSRASDSAYLTKNFGVTPQATQSRSVLSYSYPRHQHVSRAKSVPNKSISGQSNPERRNSVSPDPQFTHKRVSSQSSTNIVSRPTSDKPTTVVKVKSTHIPAPAARPTPLRAVTKPSPTALLPTAAETVADSQSNLVTGTKILYACKPSLKLLSVTTSTSTKVQSVADRSVSTRPPSKTHPVRTSQLPTARCKSALNSHQQNPTSAVSSKIPQLKQPSPAAHVYQAYDRLEGYREIVLSSPESTNSEKGSSITTATGIIRSASPIRSSSVNSDGSNVSLRSNRIRGVPEKQTSTQGSSISRSRRQSAPSSMTGSGRHTPTPTAGLSHLRKNPLNSLGDLYYPTTDESSQDSVMTSSAGVKKNSGSEPKVSVDHCIPSASPEPEIATMNILASNTVQALGTLIEVVTPTISMENLEGHVPLPESVIKEHCSTSVQSPNEKIAQSCEDIKNSTGESETFNTSSSTGGKSYPASLSTQSSASKQKKVRSQPPPVPVKKGNKNPSIKLASKLPSPKAYVSNGFKKLSAENKLNPTINGDHHDASRKAVSSLEDDDEFFGYCHQCGKAVVGEETGCLALGKVFHTTCLRCSKCDKYLSGKTFYTVGPDIFCEVDYLKSLQRCCFCNQRIKDKVLTAFGEVFHPACFRCAACGVCLDGVPYAGERYDKVYCIEDYHQLFAPPCAACGDPIVPQTGKPKNVRVKVKDRYYHVRCYKCEDCGKLFASTKQQSFMIDGHLFCQKCHNTKHMEGCIRTTVL